MEPYGMARNSSHRAPGAGRNALANMEEGQSCKSMTDPLSNRKHPNDLPA